MAILYFFYIINYKYKQFYKVFCLIFFIRYTKEVTTSKYAPLRRNWMQKEKMTYQIYDAKGEAYRSREKLWHTFHDQICCASCLREGVCFKKLQKQRACIEKVLKVQEFYAEIVTFGVRFSLSNPTGTRELQINRRILSNSQFAVQNVPNF